MQVQILYSLIKIMSWATEHIERLKEGTSVSFRPKGNSMSGIIESGQLCVVAAINMPETLQIGDVVLCKVGGNQYLHLIKDIKKGQFQIGNNRGGINGWISGKDIYGKLIKVI